MVTGGPVAGKRRNYVDELRGASRLAVAATRGVTDLVEAMHRTIGGGPALLGRPLDGATRLLTAPIYGAIRGVTSLVGAGLDAALSQLAALVGDAGSAAERAAIVSVVNGVLGDYLAASGNPLAIEMQLRYGGRPLAPERDALSASVPEASGKLVVFAHGSCLDERSWLRDGHDAGAALARELGYTPLQLHYNSGLHISTNGRALASLLEALVAAWPVPVAELAIVGHSMG
ncbi:MAG TPA: alpha/beta hydrolase, partial [Polyangia bacterium]